MKKIFYKKHIDALNISDLEERLNFVKTAVSLIVEGKTAYEIQKILNLNIDDININDLRMRIKRSNKLKEPLTKKEIIERPDIEQMILDNARWRINAKLCFSVDDLSGLVVKKFDLDLPTARKCVTRCLSKNKIHYVYSVERAKLINTRAMMYISGLSTNEIGKIEDGIKSNTIAMSLSNTFGKDWKKFLRS